MTVLPAVSHYLQAQKAASIISHILVDEMRLRYPQRFLMTEHGPFVWLLAVMDDLNLGGSINKYIQSGTLHRLSTALDGMPVYLSNHTGLRYAVLLSEKPALPSLVNFPEGELERDVMPLGVSWRGALNVPAKQIVNMIVVGAQDSGKSMALRALAHSARMHGSILCLADPLVHTFNPDYWGPVVRNKADMIKMLTYLTAEIERRSVAFRDAAKDGIQPEDLDQYNEWTGASMPRVWMIADEVNSLLDSKIVQDALGEPARAGRKFGIHMVLAGHDWHEYTVPRGLTSYFETRLCLRTSNDTAGRIVLDDSKRGKRTMQFRQPGRAILRLRGVYQDVQLYFVSSDRERMMFDSVWETKSGLWEQPQPAGSAPVADQPVSEIAQIAEKIRAQWTPELSKRAVGRLLGIPYAGAYTRKIDSVIEFLTATTTPPETPNSGFLSLNQAGQ